MGGIMPIKLLIARHGNTFAAGQEPRRVGLTDLPLVDSGIQQGYRLGEYLAQNKLIPDIIFTSTLQRTIQTAHAAQRAIQKTIPIQTLSLFNEIDYGPDENQPESVVVARLGQAALTHWDELGQVPNGWQVDTADIIDHWWSFAHRLHHDYANQTVLVITSNGIARFAPYLTGDFAAFSAQHGIKLATGALSVFEPSVTTAQWNCVQWNHRP
jgi:probable phosphoglycerate mutase